MNRFVKTVNVVLISILLQTSFALAADQVFFYYTDPAGTPLAMSDAGGTVVWSADYMPFGEELLGSSTIQNEKMFVGKEKDSETGFYYFGARYMEPMVGRFISPDSIGAVDPMTGKINNKMLANPQRLNVYNYGLNNPYRFIDSDGGWPTEVHNTIISRAFSDLNYMLTPAEIAALQRGSANADTNQYQDPAHSYMHAMRAPNQSTDEAANLMASFIAEKVAEFKGLMAAGQAEKAYEALGMAMHPLMDATSPSHQGFQEWRGMFPVIDGTTWEAYVHERKEKTDIFNSNYDYSRRAVNAIRELYDDATR